MTELMGGAPEGARALLEGIAVDPPDGTAGRPVLHGLPGMDLGALSARLRTARPTTPRTSAHPFDLGAAWRDRSPIRAGRSRWSAATWSPTATCSTAWRGGPWCRRTGRGVVEFGPGWGNLTRDMVATGLDVTAVELDEKFCALIDAALRRGPATSPSPGRHARVQHRGIRSTPPCSSRASTIAPITWRCCGACTTSCARAGRCSSAAEPVQRLDYPWGPRLDGLSVSSSRTYGWLELGFDSGYFDRALARTGWQGRRVGLGAVTSEEDVIVARPASAS